MRYRILPTPTGPFAIIALPGGGLRTAWVRGPDDPALAGGTADPSLRPDLVARLAGYFAGAAVSFEAVANPDPPPGSTGFSARCWRACRRIPRGQTRTYGELALAAGGSRRAARAAGGAMRRNPLPVIIPCHRVLPAAGGPGGFSGSVDPRGPQVALKRWLLALESI